jgi:hypothetical protein
MEDANAGELVCNNEKIATLKQSAILKPAKDLTPADYDWLHFQPPAGATMNEAIFMALRKVDC